MSLYRKIMKPISLLPLAALLTLTAKTMTAQDTPRTVSLRIIETTDVHGNFFPYNFITRTPWSGSMSRAAQFIDSVRTEAGKENVVLLDNGDILQGQPTVYYYMRPARLTIFVEPSSLTRRPQAVTTWML